MTDLPDDLCPVCVRTLRDGKCPQCGKAPGMRVTVEE